VAKTRTTTAAPNVATTAAPVTMRLRLDGSATVGPVETELVWVVGESTSGALTGAGVSEGGAGPSGAAAARRGIGISLDVDNSTEASAALKRAPRSPATSFARARRSASFCPTSLTTVSATSEDSATSITAVRRARESERASSAAVAHRALRSRVSALATAASKAGWMAASTSRRRGGSSLTMR
jgi:hypothetical protein